ncbi:MAG: ParB/RepB/Spo0J family partition protein [Geobacteraceae bacterium]|nr:ParB/RepB/Spo0J family partition protein [Geobacteraceae bacterium]
MTNGSKSIDLSELDKFDVSELISDKPLKETGKPLFIPLDQIQADPDQPRKEIDQEKLDELAESIKARGVKSPISVKPKNENGFYVINHGERRWLASQKAGLLNIPAFIDDEHDHIDQAVENIQRENLTPLEIAHFIDRCVTSGMKKNQIAKIIGKPASWVSDHALFFDFPDYIRDLYDTGRCRSIQALAVLHRSNKDFPGDISGFCSGNNDISTAEVRVFVDQLKKNDGVEPPVKSVDEHEPPSLPDKCLVTANYKPETVSGKTSPPEECNESQDQGTVEKKENIQRLKKPAVCVNYKNRAARLVLDRKPSDKGLAWLKYEDDGNEMEVNIFEVDLVALIEG